MKDNDDESECNEKDFFLRRSASEEACDWLGLQLAVETKMRMGQALSGW